MITNLLQEIRDLLKTYHEILSHISDKVDDIDNLLTSLSEVIAQIDATLLLIKQDTSDIKDDTDSIAADTGDIKLFADEINTNVDIMKQNDIDHYLANETILTAIKNLANTINTNTATIKDKTVLIENNVAGIKLDTTAITNLMNTVSTNTGAAATFAEAAATNSLGCFNRLTSLVADSTNIIALLEQLIQEVHDHGGT